MDCVDWLLEVVEKFNVVDCNFEDLICIVDDYGKVIGRIIEILEYGCYYDEFNNCVGNNIVVLMFDDVLKKFNVLGEDEK